MMTKTGEQLTSLGREALLCKVLDLEHKLAIIAKVDGMSLLHRLGRKDVGPTQGSDFIFDLGTALKTAVDKLAGIEEKLRSDEFVAFLSSTYALFSPMSSKDVIRSSALARATEVREFLGVEETDV